MEQPPNEKKLKPVSFAAHVTRGLIRDQTTRRKAMLVVIGAALLMLLLGLTLLRDILDPHERPAWFILFWLACGWLTFTALLLALFDTLLVRAQARAARKALEEAAVRGTTSNEDS